MKKIFQLLLIQILFLCNTKAQSNTIDKNKVMEYFQNQQFDEVISYLSLAAVEDTQNIQLLGYLGYAYYMNDNTAAAEKYYGAIFNIDSTNVAALQYLAILNKNDNPDGALQYTRRLINLQPSKAAHYRSMAELFRRKDKRDSAYVNYNKAFELSPEDAKNGVGLAHFTGRQKVCKGRQHH